MSDEKIQVNDTVRLARMLKESVRMSVLHTSIDPDYMGAHDFGESCYRVYTQLKEILQESNRNMSVGYRDYRNISFDLEMFLKHYLIRFLIKYHKKLWKRFDVPKKVFFSVGSSWYSDVDQLRSESNNFIQKMDNVLDKYDKICGV